MKCVNCGCEDLKVFDSRSAPGNSVRRRRRCMSCGLSFTTYEFPVDMAEGERTLKHTAIVGDSYSTQDIQDRILGACSMLDITPTDVQYIMQCINKKRGNAKTIISSQQIDIYVLQILREYSPEFFNAYAMRRFNAKTAQQLLDLWNLESNLDLMSISKIVQDDNSEDAQESNNSNDENEDTDK